jgi:predicted Zn-dependent peptidase
MQYETADNSQNCKMEDRMITQRMRRLLVLGCGLLLIPMAVAGFDFSKLENSVTEFTLDNGLKFIVMERHEAPTVSFVTWADVGSVDDPKGYTGLAHMFEHMAFKGTSTLGTKDIEKELELIAKEDSIFMLLRAERVKKFPDSERLSQLEAAYEEAREASYQLVEPNEFGNVYEREGGISLNAGTGSDFTAYIMEFPSNRLELWMALESERFLDPVLREMYKERDVVAEERRMRYESNPVGKLFEEFLGVAFKSHPYGVPGIGNMSDINYYSREEALVFFDKYYGPSNLTVGIVGDVDPKQVKSMAEKYFGRIPARPKPPLIATVEPPQKGERRVVVQDPSQPVLIVGWHVPELTHPDRPALDAMFNHLGSGRTAVLYKSLVKEKKIAAQIGMYTGIAGEKYPTISLLFCIPASGYGNDTNETEILTAVEQVRSNLLTPDELKKIKARAKADFINQLDRNGGFGGMAFQLTAYETYFGDWRELFKELDRINAVTAEDIKRVANEYLTPANRVVGRVETSES